MAGILRYGAYVPYYRLTAKQVAEAWAGRGGRGEKAVANHDEDALTLAVEAARDCLHGWDRSLVDGIFFVSTTAPYREKQGAAFLATVLDLRPDVLTSDFSHALRAATTAMDLAAAVVDSGRARSILVACADVRPVRPGSPQEVWAGDGGAAFLVGKGACGVRWERFVSLSNEMHDTWRTDRDAFVRSWEDRWVKQHGLFATTVGAVRRLLEETDLDVGRIDRAVLPAPDPRSHKQLARKIGLDETTTIADALLDSVGSAGAAHVPMMLVRALEEAGPDERILLASYGDGCDAVLLSTTADIQACRGRRAVTGHLESKALLPGYTRYLWYRGLVDVHPPQPLLVGSSATVLWRDKKQVLSLHGSRCTSCGEAAYPAQRVCNRCGSVDTWEELPLAEARGKLFTYTLDHLAAQKDPPLVQSVIDLEPGCRLYTSMTDVEPDSVRLEMEVEMTFRRMREAEGFYNYFWKCRPLR